MKKRTFSIQLLGDYLVSDSIHEKWFIFRKKYIWCVQLGFVGLELRLLMMMMIRSMDHWWYQCAKLIFHNIFHNNNFVCVWVFISVSIGRLITRSTHHGTHTTIIHRFTFQTNSKTIMLDFRRAVRTHIQ